MNKLFNISESNFEGLGKLSLDYIYALELLANGAVPETSKFNALSQGLVRKGFIDEGLNLTDIGKELYEGLLQNKSDVRVKKIAIDKNGLLGIHAKLEDKLFKCTGKRQIRAKFPGSRKEYSFLCNKDDLINRLAKTIAKYKLTDFEAIENVLLIYIERCCETRQFFPLLHYYILKKGDDGIERSEMVTDLQSGEVKDRSKSFTGDTII